jgi:ceramide glucosyltransferase
LVSSVIAGAGERSAGAAMENLHLASFVCAAVCAAHALARHACVVGKSMLFRLSDLRRVGGFRAVRNLLAEDYVLGQRFQRAGFRVALSSHAVETVVESWGVQRFLERHLRWSQMRRRLNLPAYLGEPLLNPSPLLFAALLCGYATANRQLAAFALLGLCAKAGSDLLLLRHLRGSALRAADLPLLFVKDALVLGIWAVGLFRQTICWRGHRMRVAAGSVLLPLPADPRRAPAEAA